MSLLEPKTWDGQVYSGGWTTSHGGDAAIVEPATGGELGRTGVADAEDVSRASAAAAAAQREWAATSFEERAAVLRRAGALIEEHADEIQRWAIRETGAVPGIAAFAVGVTAASSSPASSRRPDCRTACCTCCLAGPLWARP